MPVAKFRNLFGSRLAQLVDYRIEERTRDVIQDYETRIDELEHCTADHRRRLAETEEKLETAVGDLRWMRGELDRLMPHVAAQEAQLETLRESLAMTPRADAGDTLEARTLIEEIQRQHAQIRIRMAGIARYEERLSRLENAKVPSTQ
jgi:chromosome segregation ATPase